jgi:glyceraldehyde 3-phosphate dehydrogenase
MDLGASGGWFFGRFAIRGCWARRFDVVAVNDLVPADNLAYLVKYDSTQGRAKEEVYSKKSSPSVAEDDLLVVDGHEIKCLAVKEGPAALPWKALGVDIVLECTGLFTEGRRRRATSRRARRR